jgi:hypothetical protein
MLGAYVRKKVLGWVCLHIGAPFGGPGERGLSTGNFERWIKGALGMGSLSLLRGSLWRALREGSFTGYPVL